MRRRPVGVVLVFSDLAPAATARGCARAAIPFVIVDPAGDPSPEVPSVGSANWSGGLMATRHLIELGHRRIAAITGPDDMMCSLARVDGYRSAMNSAGLPIDPELGPVRRLPRRRRRDARPRPAGPGRPADRDLRRAATCRRSASSRRARPPGSASPTTSRSSATTTSRCPVGEPAPDDRAPAAAPDGRRGHAPRDPARPRRCRRDAADGSGHQPGRARKHRLATRRAHVRRRGTAARPSPLTHAVAHASADTPVQRRVWIDARGTRPVRRHRVRSNARGRRSNGRRRARARPARRCGAPSRPVNDARSVGTSNDTAAARPAAERHPGEADQPPHGLDDRTRPGRAGRAGRPRRRRERRCCRRVTDTVTPVGGTDDGCARQRRPLERGVAEAVPERDTPVSGRWWTPRPLRASVAARYVAG